MLQLKAQYKDVTGEDVPGPAKKEKKKGKAVSYNKNLVKSRYFVVHSPLK